MDSGQRIGPTSTEWNKSVRVSRLLDADNNIGNFSFHSLFFYFLFSFQKRREGIARRFPLNVSPLSLHVVPQAMA